MNHNMHYGPSSASPGFYGHHNHHYISAQLQYQQQQQQAYLGMGHQPPQDFQAGHHHSYGGHEGPPSPSQFPDGAFAHQQQGFGHFQQQQDGGGPFYNQSQSPGAYMQHQHQQYVGDDASPAGGGKAGFSPCDDNDLSKMRYAAHMQRFGGFPDEASGEMAAGPGHLVGRVRAAALSSPEAAELSPYDYYPAKAKVIKREAPVSNSDSRINRPGEQQLHRQQRSDSNSGNTLDEQRDPDRPEHANPSMGPGMDNIPDLPEIPDLKFGGVGVDDHDGGGKDVGDCVKEDDVDRMAAMAQQRQEEYLPAQGMHGMHQFPMQMGYPGGQMWNYNYMYGQQPGAAASGGGGGGGGIGGGDGFSQGLSNPSMEGLMAAAAAAAAGGPVWWGGGGAGSAPSGQSPSPLQRVPSPGEGGFRMPGGLQAPGPWALRAPRPRSDRRGPGRPRLSGAKGAGSAAHARMSPPEGMEPFPFSGPPHADMGPEMMPASPPAPTGNRKRGPGRPRAGLPLSSPGLLDPATGVISGMIVPEGKAGKAANAANAANKKRYTCEVCQKRFSTAWYVRVHRKSHNGERPYICHNCGKGFMLPNVLQVHLRKCEKTQQAAAAAASAGLTPAVVGGGNGVQAGPPSIVRPEMDPDLDDPSPPMPSPSAPSSLHPHASPMGMVSQPYIEHHPSSMLPQSHYGGMGGFSQRYHEHQEELGGANSQYHPMSDFSERPVHGGYGMPGNPHHLQHRLPTPAHHHESSASPSGGHLGSTAGISSSPPGHYAQPMFSPGVDDSSAPAFQQQPGPAHFLGLDRPRDKGGGSAPSAPSSPEGSSCASPTPPPTEDNNSAAPRNNRPHTCEVCEKRFSQKCNLITHMRLHTGERPYACSFCDKRFTQKGNLDAHLKTHTKEKPYRCPQCDKRFAFKSSMVSHFKQTHGSGDRSPAMSPEPFRGVVGASAVANGPYEFDEDEITSLKHQLRFSAAARSPEAFSTGIPTPQSSTDSLLGCVANNGQPPVVRSHLYGAVAMAHHHPANSDHVAPPHHNMASPAATLH